MKTQPQTRNLLKHSIAILAAACCLLTAHSAALAQSSTVQPPLATISGVAVDSIRGGYLKNAIIVVSGTNRTAVTDSTGRFFMDSVPSGSRSIRIRHALLDSIALSVVTPPQIFAPGSSVTLMISTPGPGTIVAAKCPADARAAGPAALLGTVFDADTEDPSAGAQVSAEWNDLELGSKSIRNVPQRRSTTVSADGTFVLCGLPRDLHSGIHAFRAADTTAAVRAELASGLDIISLHLPRSNAATIGQPDASRTSTTGNAGSDARPATVTGRITDVSGNPISGARAAIDEDRVSATTAANGTFTLRGARAGTRTLTVRKLGFEPVSLAVDLTNRRPYEIDLELAKFVPLLETVRISALRDSALTRIGFAARHHSGFGSFITPEDIARRNSIRLNDMLRGVSFLHFNRRPNGTDVISGRMGGCVRYFVDGIPWVSVSDSPDSFYSPSEVGAIEIYNSTTTPSQFMSFSSKGELCSVIVVWTKSGLRLR